MALAVLNCEHRPEMVGPAGQYVFLGESGYHLLSRGGVLRYQPLIQGGRRADELPETALDPDNARTLDLVGRAWQVALPALAEDARNMPEEPPAIARRLVPGMRRAAEALGYRPALVGRAMTGPSPYTLTPNRGLALRIHGPGVRWVRRGQGRRPPILIAADTTVWIIDPVQGRIRIVRDELLRLALLRRRRRK